MTERRDRRDILKAAAVAGALGLAGCVGGDDDGGENGSERSVTVHRRLQSR